jgi:hypothetical protein
MRKQAIGGIDMGVNMEKPGDAEIFQLAPVDINHLFRRSGLNGNGLSLYSYNAEQAATSSPSELFRPLAESANFTSIANKILAPDLKIEFNRGGAGSAEETYHAFLSLDDNDVLAHFQGSDGNILLMLFDNEESFLQWWSDIYASKAASNYQPVFPEVFPIEVLVCALHCIDIYRRSYLESMLDYRGGLDLAISTQDFVQLLRRSLASQDKRWLLPTMFEITAGLKGINIALKPEHIKKVEELGFLTIDENVLTLGERSRLMGTEIITSWLGSISCQASALVNGQEKSLSRIFMTPTAFANHLFSFEIGAEGEARFRHQAITLPELVQTLMKWIEALQKAIGGTAPAHATPRPAPAMKFCGQCGAELKPGKKFCTSCGTSI